MITPIEKLYLFLTIILKLIFLAPQISASFTCTDNAYLIQDISLAVMDWL